MVPLRVIDKAIELIMSGDTINYVYNPSAGNLVENPST